MAGLGSSSKVSNPAKANFPLSKAFKSATSSITPPRAAFTIAAHLSFDQTVLLQLHIPFVQEREG